MYLTRSSSYRAVLSHTNDAEDHEISLPHGELFVPDLAAEYIERNHPSVLGMPNEVKNGC